MIKRILKKLFGSEKIQKMEFYITKNGDGKHTCFSTIDGRFKTIVDPAKAYIFINEVMQNKFYVDLFDYSCLFDDNDVISQCINAAQLRENFEKKLRFDKRTIIHLGVYFK